MTIGEELTGFLERFPACLAVAYADLSTGMVLASRTVEKMAQEKLDALCEIGRDCLLGANASRVLDAFSDPQSRRVHVALHSDTTGFRCFVKVPDPESEAICLLVGGSTLPDGICNGAEHLLRRISVER